MQVEEFQIAYLRSSRLFLLLEAPIVGPLVRSILARRCLARTRRLLSVTRELERHQSMLKAKTIGGG